MKSDGNKTAASLYKSYEKHRSLFLTQADKCAASTLPRFHSKIGDKDQRFNIDTPQQSIGAHGVNNITSKLLLTLFPSNTLFFAKKANSATIQQADAVEQKANIEKALQDRDNMILEHIESVGDRPKLNQVLLRAVITGNVLIFVPPHTSGSIRIFPLQQYVVKRDGKGNLLELIVKESVSPLMLDADEIGEELKESLLEKYAEDSKDIELYTHVKFDGKVYHTYQEIEEKKIERTEGSYPKDSLPWIALRFTAIDGEDYGRSFIEEILGDLQSLEILTRAITSGAAAASRILIFVRPEGQTNIDDVSEKENGGVIYGREEDVGILQLDKRSDLQTAEQLIKNLEERLSTAFLLNSSVQRPGERVTAEEIRYVARELEDGLGGIYSTLSHELQLPYVLAREWRLLQENLIPPLPKDLVQPTIVTGFDALGRGNDKMKLVNFLRAANEVLGPEVAARFVDPQEFFTRLGTADGIETVGLIKSEEQLAAEQEQAQLQQLAPEALKQAGGIAQAAIKQPTQQ